VNICLSIVGQKKPVDYLWKEKLNNVLRKPSFRRFFICL
jgi:hypothetical protein